MRTFVEAHRNIVTPGAIGLVNVRSVNDRVNVVRVNGKLPLEAGYLPH